MRLGVGALRDPSLVTSPRSHFKANCGAPGVVSSREMASKLSSSSRSRMWLVVLLCVAVAGCVEAMQTNVSQICSPSATLPMVVKGQRTYVCINVNGNYRSVFMPIADKFTALRVTDSWNDTRIGMYSAGAYITISSHDYRTYYKLYSSNAGKIFPYLTAIISVKKGVVQGVTWDDGCYFCEASACESNLFAYATNTTASTLSDGYTCYSNLTACGSNSTVCDLTLYVGWTGTDRDGNYLSSAGMRISQFQRYSISSYFKKIAASFSTLLPSTADE